MRCARRQNDAAYQHYRRRSVSGRHAIIIHRRQVQHQSSRGMFITLWMARLPLRHRPIVLRSPVNGSESAIGRGCIRATGWDAFILKPVLRVPYVYSAYRTQPKYNILTSTRFGAQVYKCEKLCIKTNEFSIQNLCLQVRAGSFHSSFQMEERILRHEHETERASGRSRARTRPRVRTASTQTILKASSTAHQHVHARPAVGITSTEPGRKASPCKPGGRARPRFLGKQFYRSNIP